MRVLKKLCDGCNRPKPIWKNSEGKRYCKQCWSAQHPPAKPTAGKKPIPSRSFKRIPKDVQYQKLRIAYLNEHSMCEAHLSGCSNYSTDVHHKKGRGIYYLDVSTFLAVCRTCHNWIENHPEEAKELGFSTQRI